MTRPNRRGPFADDASQLGGGRWALPFVAASLVALAALPAWVSMRGAEAQRRITEVLEPAAREAAELLIIQSRQMSLYQSFLLTGDPRIRLDYAGVLPRKDTAFARLQHLTQQMDWTDFSIRERLAALTNESTSWHMRQQQILQIVDPQEAARRAAGTVDQASFEALRQSTRELERAIRREMSTAYDDIREGRTLLQWTTFGLVFLALGATIVVGFVGRHLRVLTIEARRRGREADRARWEMSALMEATGEGVLGIDRQGRCMSLNRAGTELLGYTEDELVGRDVHGAIHHTRQDGRPRDRASSPILRALERERRARSSDDVLWRRDGTPLPVRWSLRPIPEGRTTRGAVLTFVDMTETRQRESELERAVRARDDMMSVVSHDLRNPLGVVAAAADLLVDLPLSAEERRKQVEIIARSAGRMGRLIDDLLDVSRLEAGALVMRPQPVEVGRILEETAETFEPQARECGIILAHGTAPGTPPIFADRERVLQAIENLVTNAIRYTSQGGRIDLRAANCENGTVSISVADTGRGIEPAALDRLFDRFWRPTSSDGSGMGLGLAIVKGIVEGSGGTVAVESELGRGSVFTLRFPVAGRRR